jgi:hypothetical protein
MNEQERKDYLERATMEGFQLAEDMHRDLFNSKLSNEDKNHMINVFTFAGFHILATRILNEAVDADPIQRFNYENAKPIIERFNKSIEQLVLDLAEGHMKGQLERHNF